jgi:hypothetical protein
VFVGAFTTGMALEINVRSRVAKYVSLPFTIIFVPVVGTSGEVLGGGFPWRKTTAFFDAFRWCSNNSGSWSVTTTVRVNETAGADLYRSNSSNSSNAAYHSLEGGSSD